MDSGTSSTFALSPRVAGSGSPENGPAFRNIYPPLAGAPAGWRGRYFAAAAAQGKHIVLTGGLVTADPNEKKDVITSIWRSDDTGVSWNLVSRDVPFGVRFGHSLVLLNDGMLLFAGASSLTTTYNDMWHSDDLGVTWTQRIPEDNYIFSPRFGHASIVEMSSNTLLVMGGSEWASTNGIVPVGNSDWSRFAGYNDVWMSRDSGESWTLQTSAAPWPKRFLHQTFWRQNSVYIVGGIAAVSRVFAPLTDVWCSDDSGVSWTKVSQAASPFSSRIGGMAVTFSATSYLLGGAKGLNFLMGSDALPDVTSTEDNGHSWTQLSAIAPFNARAGAAYVLTGQTLVVIGGAASGTAYVDVWTAELPNTAISSDGTVVAAVIGSIAGILLVLFVVKRCLAHAREGQAKPNENADAHSSKKKKRAELDLEEQAHMMPLEMMDETEEMQEHA